MDITEVIFRKFSDNQVCAFFPYEIADRSGNISSYMHVGQHSGASFDCLVSTTKLANEIEYGPLKTELESIGYNLKIISKRNHNKYLSALEMSKQD